MTEIKLNRLANVLDAKFWTYPAFVGVFVMAIFIIVNPEEELMLSLVFFAFILVVFEIFSYPSEMSIGKDTIVYTDKQSVRVYPGKGGTRTVRVTYTVTRLYELEFRQNRLEGFFNVGTVVFGGNTSMQASRYEDLVEFPDVHKICGIKNFSQTKSLIESIIK